MRSKAKKHLQIEVPILLCIIFLAYNFIQSANFNDNLTKSTMRTVKERIDSTAERVGYWNSVGSHEYNYYKSVLTIEVENIDSTPGVLGMLLDENGDLLSRRFFGPKDSYGWDPLNDSSTKLNILYKNNGYLTMDYPNSKIEIYWKRIYTDKDKYFIMVGGVVKGVGFDIIKDVIISSTIATAGILTAIVPIITDSIKKMKKGG